MGFLGRDMEEAMGNRFGGCQGTRKEGEREKMDIVDGPIWCMFNGAVLEATIEPGRARHCVGASWTGGSQRFCPSSSQTIVGAVARCKS